MKYKSHIISQGSGKVAGLVYSFNRSGLYTRNWRKPVNSPTDAKTLIRSQLTSLVTAWTQLLSETQRQGWSTYAANVPVIDSLGNSIHITGQNWYIGSNTPRIQAGLSRIDDAPTIFDRGNYTPITAVANVSTQMIDITFSAGDTWANSDGGFMNIYVARPINAGRTFFKGPYLFAGVILGDSGTPPTSPVSIPVPFPINDGQAVGVRVTVGQADARYSTPQFTLPVTNFNVLDNSIQTVAFTTDGTDGMLTVGFERAIAPTAAIATGLNVDDGGSGWLTPTAAGVVIDPQTIKFDFGVDISGSTALRLLNSVGLSSSPGTALVLPETRTIPFP